MDSTDDLERKRSQYLANAAEAQTRAVKTDDPKARAYLEQIQLGWLNMAEATRLKIAARKNSD